MKKVQVVSNTDLRQTLADSAEVWLKWYLELAKRKRFVVGGWCGGNSVRAFAPGIVDVMERIPEELRAKHHLFLTDERLLGDCNAEVLDEVLVDPAIERGFLTRSQAHWYPLQFVCCPGRGTAAYEQMLAGFGGKFDYVILGTGYPHQRSVDGMIEKYDCHVAGTFAHHPSTEAQAAQGPAYFFFDGSPKPPNCRVTATQALLRLATVGFLLVIGKQKHAVLDEFLDRRVLLADCPAKIVQQMDSRVIVTDRKLGFFQRLRV